MSAKARILVAEDDHAVRDLIRIKLELAGYEVQTARNGAEALQVVRDRHPDAMVLDINMPEVDGVEVLRALPGWSGKTRIPVLVLTARHAVADVQLAISLGAKDYLAKPFSDNILLARVARLLRPALSAPKHALSAKI
jgi:DNA-binding response OmpR family regulator